MTMADQDSGSLLQQDALHPAAIIQRARDAGVELRVEGARLRFRAPDGALTPALRELLRSRRDELIAQLRADAAADRKTGRIGANQRGLWFLNRLAPASAAYNVGFAARIHGPVDVALLHEAVQVLVDRHESLRTSYPETNGEPARVVAGYQPVEFRYYASRVASDELLRDAVAAEYARPFDAATGPLFRAALFEESAERAVLLLAAHHLAVDGTSLFVLLDELFAVYAALAAGQPSPLRAVETQFTDFVEWQQAAVRPDGDDAAFWRDALTPPPQPLDLFTDRSRPAVPRLNGSTLRSTLDAAVSEQVAQIARAEGTTEFVALLTLWFSFLHRLTTRDDITIGTPVHGRSSVRFERTVGDLINMVPLRMRDIGARPLRELLREAHRTTMQALAHQDFPLPWMTELGGARRNTVATPFQSLFVLQDFSQFGDIQKLFLGDECDRIPLGGLTLSPFPFDQQEGQFDISLEVCRTGDTLACVWKYDTDLFDEETVRRHIDEYRTFVADALQRPDTPIAALEIVPPAQRAQLDAWNETRRDYPTDVTLDSLLSAQAARTPDAIAVRSESGVASELTYAELDRRANTLASKLQDMGVGPDTRVAVRMNRSAELVVSLVAILLAGGAYVPVDPWYPEERQKYMLEDCGAPVLLTQSCLGGAPVSDDVAKVIPVDAIWGELDTDRTARHVSTPDSLAYIIYTSGSTGRPKGAMIEHRSIVNRLEWMQDHFGLGDDDAVLQKTPYSFDVSVWEFFWPLMKGAKLVMAQPEGHKDPSYLAKVIAAENVTTLHFVPSMLGVFLESKVGPLPSLRRVICSGEALSPGLVTRFSEQFPDVELTNLYGPTEAAVDVSWWRCGRDQPGATVPIGWPVANTKLYILDGNLQHRPIGVPGELFIGGIQVGRGYLNRPELTAERFIDSPFAEGERLYRTGDLARYQPDGAIEFLGRLDHQVKIRGFRIELGEIEARLLAHPDVSDAVVVVHDDRLFAYLVTRTTPPDAGIFRAWVGELLPEYMVPAAFVLMDTLPLTPSGKVDRRALPEPTVAGALDRSARSAPGTPTELALAGIWSAILDVEDPRLEDSFFELGGHSLLAARMLAAIRDRFGVNLSMRTIFESVGLGALALRIDEELTVPADASTGLETFEF